VRLLAEWLIGNAPPSYVLPADRIELVYRTAPLHDIGKVGVPDNILLKPGKLTPEEFEVMKKHTLFGYNALNLAAAGLGTTSFLTVACEITLQHHERWDGKGYPNAVAGEKIALSARLMALADVYDALISKRCYKEPMPPDKARQIILEGRGTQFDPVITGAFEAITDRFESVAREHAD
jgi:HD-GYP domain-containing protein (c-di-GMP phosphodiesterase class II)